MTQSNFDHFEYYSKVTFYSWVPCCAQVGDKLVLLGKNIRTAREDSKTPVAVAHSAPSGCAALQGTAKPLPVHSLSIHEDEEARASSSMAHSHTAGV